MKLDFNQDIDFIDGEGSEEVFKENLVGLLRQGNTAQDAMEAAVLDDLTGDIARSDDPIEISERDLEVLEDNINRLVNNDDNEIPNWLLGKIGKLIKEGKDKLAEQ